MKKWCRSRKKRMIAGVLGGLSEVLPFEVDPTILRVCAVVFAIGTCFIPIILIYLTCWIVVPREENV